MAGHVNIGDGATVGAEGGGTKDVRPGSFVSGFPAMPHERWKRMHAHVMRLPELKKKMAAMQRRLEALERASGTGEA